MSPPQTLPSTQKVSYNTTFYTSPPLANQQHTLSAVVTTSGPTYFLDYLQYDDGSNSANETTTICSHNTISSTTAPYPTNSSHLTTVLTAVLIPLCVVLIAAIAFYVRYSRRRNVPVTREGTVYPFACPPLTVEPSGALWLDFFSFLSVRSDLCPDSALRRGASFVSSVWRRRDRTPDSSHSPHPTHGLPVGNGEERDLTRREKNIGAARLAQRDAASSGSEVELLEAEPPAYEG